MEALRVVEIGVGSPNAIGSVTASATSSPGRARSGVFFSAPTSPMRSSPARKPAVSYRFDQSFKMEDDAASRASASPGGSGSDFEFSARFSELEGDAVSADELFFNGQIRPTMHGAPLDKPQVLWPFIDLENESSEREAHCDCLDPQGQDPTEEEGDGGSRGRERALCREKSRHRRTRSLSPLRSSPQWEPPQEEIEPSKTEEEEKSKAETSSAKKGRSGSKRWISLKDFLYRSKSEGRDQNHEKHWAALSCSSSPAKQHSTSSKKEGSCAENPKAKNKDASNSTAVPGPISGIRGNNRNVRRVPVSAHELHYTAKRAQAEQLRHRTYLPYRQGLFGFLGFSSKSHNTFNGFTTSLHPAFS